jgi:hypothetical protein
MAWPIPDIPEKYSFPKPKIWLWIVVLLVIPTFGFITSMWVFKTTNYDAILLSGVLSAFLLWLCIFGVVFNRYEQSSNARISWEAERERTKAEWQQWSRRQLAVVGNVLFSPEENGMESLLGEFEDVPAYPEKARPLFNSPCIYASLMRKIDLNLEQQYPRYRNLMHAIYVLQASGRYDKKSNKAIFQQWDLVPDIIDPTQPLHSLFDSHDSDGLVLIICFQNWSALAAGEVSEFISAQLMAMPKYARQHSIPVIAGLNRIMPLEAGSFKKDLDMFFEYSQAGKQDLEYIWLSGNTEKTTAEIMQYATDTQWLLPNSQPLRSVDFSFGPPGEMALPLGIAMMVEVANKKDKDQLFIYQTPHQTGALCLITRELYL